MAPHSYAEMGTSAYPPWQAELAVPASDFGYVLRKIRMASKPFLSQSQLARAAGFDHSYVSRLEAGTRNPTLDAVHNLAKALRASPQEIDELLMAAGFLPNRVSITIVPQLLRLAKAMAEASPEANTDALAVVQALTSVLERANEHDRYDPHRDY